MGTPDFILELRKYIGHRPLWLIGVTACVFNKQGQVLLGQRSDTQQWESHFYLHSGRSASCRY